MCSVPDFFFFSLQWCTGVSPWTLGPHKGFLICGNCLSQCPPGAPGPQLREDGAHSGSTARTKGLPVTWEGKTPFRSLALGARSQSSHRGTVVHGWTLNYCCWGRGYSDGHLIWPFCGNHSFKSFDPALSGLATFTLPAEHWTTGLFRLCFWRFQCGLLLLYSIPALVRSTEWIFFLLSGHGCIWVGSLQTPLYAVSLQKEK